MEFWLWPIARVMESEEPPEGSTKAWYWTPRTCGRSRTSGATQASTASLPTNAAMSSLNSASHSDEAAAGSSSMASSITDWSMVGFSNLVGALITSTLPSLVAALARVPGTWRLDANSQAEKRVYWSFADCDSSRVHDGSGVCVTN